MAFIEQEANEKAEEIDAKVPYSHIFWAGADITWLVISVFHNVLVAVCPRAGRRRVQHREGPAGADPAAEDNGVLREEGEADWAAEENVSSQWVTSGRCPQLPLSLGAGGGGGLSLVLWLL